MRISSLMMQQAALRNLRVNQQTLLDAEIAAATGRRVRTMSDDPVDAAQIMRLDTQLRGIETYRRNAAVATTRFATEDTVLASIHELLNTAKSIAASIASDDPADPKRQAALAEIAILKEQAVALGNTRIGNEFIFGGGQTSSAPFLPDGTYVGDGTVRRIEIDAGIVVNTNETGDLTLSKAMAALDDLALQIQSGTAADVAATMATLESARQSVLVRQSVVGARLGMLEDNLTALARRSNDLLDRREAIRDVDQGEAILKVMSAQSSLERAYAVIGRVMQTSIVDFLR